MSYLLTVFYAKVCDDSFGAVHYALLLRLNKLNFENELEKNFSVRTVLLAAMEESYRYFFV